jgi:hypothetical protein
MRHLIVRVAALTLVLVGVGPTSAARACGPGRPGIQYRWGFPANGAVGVPTNAQVVVSYRTDEVSFLPSADAGDPGLGTDLELRRFADGEPVPFTISQFRTGASRFERQVAFVLRPRSPLSPRTPYEVLDRRQHLPCGPGQAHSCAPGELRSISAFTTGDGERLTPPSTPAGASLKAEGLNRCDSGGCCGPFLVQKYTARWDEAVPSEVVLYNLYSGGEAVARLLNVTQVPLGVPCAGPSDPSRLVVPAGSLHVRAVDWAGNESAEARLGAIPLRVCENVGFGGACSAGGSPSGGWWWATAGLAVLAIGSRLRRRRL